MTRSAEPPGNVCPGVFAHSLSPEMVVRACHACRRASNDGDNWSFFSALQQLDGFGAAQANSDGIATVSRVLLEVSRYRYLTRRRRRRDGAGMHRDGKGESLSEEAPRDDAHPASGDARPLRRYRACEWQATDRRPNKLSGANLTVALVSMGIDDHRSPAGPLTATCVQVLTSVLRCPG